MTTRIFKVNTIFLLLMYFTFVFVFANEKEAFYNEITTAEDLSKQNSTSFYCLVISPKESDRETLENISSNDNEANQFLLFLFFVRKELHYPTVYLFHNGIIQLRQKVTQKLTIDAFDSIYNYIKHQYNTHIQNNKGMNRTDNAIALISLTTKHQLMNDEHLKKIIIAIIVVLLLSITLVLITKYSIDWAISSRLDLNLEKEIKKKEAVDTLIEYTYKRTDMHDNTKLEYDLS